MICARRVLRSSHRDLNLVSREGCSEEGRMDATHKEIVVTFAHSQPVGSDCEPPATRGQR